MQIGLTVLLILVVLGVANSQESCDADATLAKLKELIDSHYLWRAKLVNFNPTSVEDAIKHLRKIGDSWTMVTKETDDDLWYNQSKIVGIGIRWNEERYITKVFNNSPAQKAGLKKHDKILSIQGEIDADKWVEKIRRTGVESPIEVVVLRDGKLLRFDIYKDAFEIPSVDEVYVFEHNGKRYGYIQLNNFTNPSVEVFIKEIKKLRDQNIDVLVLDLRYNGGGLISVVRRIAGVFIGDENPLFYLERPKGGVTLYGSEGRAIYDKKVILLVSKATASASEILASLLRYYRKAKVYGSLSAGKYVGSNIYKLNECGDVLRLVSFEVKLMDGYPVVSEIGILPDCFVRQPTNYFPEELIQLCESVESESVAFR